MMEGSSAKPRKKNTRALFHFLLVLLAAGALFILLLSITGGSKGNPKRRAVLVQLKALDELMKEYMAAGHPEPRVMSPWIYGDPSSVLYLQPAYCETSPGSDPVNWIIALQSSPVYSKKLDGLGLVVGSDAGILKNKGYTAVNAVIQIGRASCR